MPSTRFVFFGPIGKTRWPPGLWLAKTFSTSPLKPLNRIQWNLIGSKISTPSTKFVFLFGRSEKQNCRPGLWLAKTFSTSPLKLLNRIQWNLIGSKISTPSTKFVFLFGRSEKQNGRPGLWLAETFSTSPLKPLNGIQWNLIGSKISTPSNKFVFFGPIGKTKWPPWPLIGWDIFDFSFETVKGIRWNLIGSKISMPSTKFVFFRWIGKTKWPPWPICWDILNFSSETAERNSTKLDRKQDLNILYQACVFRADQKNKIAALSSDWLRHFWLLLWNHWTEFNETWQKASSQRPLPSLCFSGWSKKQYGRPGLWLDETYFVFSSETAERNLWIYLGEVRGGGAPIHVYVWEHIVSLY